VEHHVLKLALHHNVIKNLFPISTNIPVFFPVYWLARGPRAISLPVRGPIGSTFAGPHLVVCAELFEGHHVITTEIVDVKGRSGMTIVSPHQHKLNGERRNAQ